MRCRAARIARWDGQHAAWRPPPVPEHRDPAVVEAQEVEASGSVGETDHARLGRRQLEPQPGEHRGEHLEQAEWWVQDLRERISGGHEAIEMLKGRLGFIDEQIARFCPGEGLSVVEAGPP